jgi:hypothetical protein
MREADSTAVRELTEFVHLTWPANPHQLASIRTQVRGWLAPLDLTEEFKEDLVFAVNEAASNSVEHAYFPPTPGDTVESTFWTEADAVCLRLRASRCRPRYLIARAAAWGVESVGSPVLDLVPVALRTVGALDGMSW